jgi:hypothetical protein
MVSSHYVKLFLDFFKKIRRFRCTMAVESRVPVCLFWLSNIALHEICDAIGAMIRQVHYDQLYMFLLFESRLVPCTNAS